MQVQETPQQVSILKVLEVLRRRKFWLLPTVLLVTTAFVVYAVGQADRFRSETLLTAQPAVPNYVKGNAPDAPVNVQEKLWIIREHLLNPAVLGNVMDEFHLYPNNSPETFLQEMQARARLFWKAAARALQFYRMEEMTEPERRQHQIEHLKSQITIQVEAADAFSIGFEGNTREQAMDVANHLGDILIQRTSAVSEQSATWAADFLKVEAAEVKQKLDQQNEQIREYQRQASDLPTRLAADLRFLETLQEQLHAKTERLGNEQARRAAVLQEMKDLEDQGALAEPESKSPTDIKLQELRARLKQLQATYKEQHPAIRSLEAEIRDFEKTAGSNPETEAQPRVDPSPSQLRYLALKAELEEIDQRLQSYQQQEKKLSLQLATFERNNESAPQRDRTLAELIRDYDLTRTEYQTLLERQNQAQLDERLSKVNQSSVFRIVRRAPLPLEPSAPRRGRIILMGLMAGFGLGMMLAIFSEYRDTSYNTPDEFRESTNLPLLTVVPDISASNGRSGSPRQAHSSPLGIENLEKNHIVTLCDPRSIASEQYGILAMEVLARLGRESPRVLAVTSAAGGEGKTLTSLNLSITLSRTMEGRVLLLESDLRRPRLQEYLCLHPKRGFSDLLKEPEGPLEPYIVRLNGLSIIPGGAILEEPLKLLSSQRTQDLLGRLRERFEFIVVDTPPILPIADSHILSGLVDGVILVVRAQHTRRELLRHALQSFHASNVLGVVLNGVDLRHSRYSHAYDYYATQYLGRETGTYR